VLTAVLGCCRQVLLGSWDLQWRRFGTAVDGQLSEETCLQRILGCFERKERYHDISGSCAEDGFGSVLYIYE
jgi:hypothetical protein